MNTLTTPVTYNAKQFTWLTRYNLMTIEASDLGWRPGVVLDRFTITNDSGERRAIVRYTAMRRDKEGEIMYWQYEPESVEDKRQFKPGTKVRIYND